MDDAAAVSEVLDECPELEDPLRAVLDVDDENEAWTFDDLPIDSGAFGELVSRGLVERTDDGDAYHLTDSDAVRAALDRNGPTDGATATDDATADDDATAPFSSPSTTDLSLDTSAITDRFAAVDRQTVSAVAAALLAVVLARAYVYGAVFRGGDVVLSANDPYYYRYWVEQALSESNGAFDVSALGTISGAVQTGEPLLVATLWFFSSLFGGDATAAGWVLAWYPVIAGVVTAFLVYLLAMRVTDDRRIALAATVLLAVTPAHAMRTSLGFADHHAFDYVWLMVTAHALVRLDADADGRLRDPGRWAWAVVLGVGIAGQTLAWDAGPLLVIPVGGYLALRVLHDVENGTRPLRAHFPLLAGLGGGALVVYLGHAVVGWHSTVVAFAPMLLWFGAVSVLAAGDLAVRFDASSRSLAAVEAVGVVAGLLAAQTLLPEYWGELMNGLDLLTSSRDIAETQSLLSGDAFGWLLLFGFVLLLAFPYLVWGSVRAYRGEHTWLALTVYCWYFFVLAALQVRFAGQLAMFAALFAGVGFVHLAERVDLTSPPAPFESGPDIWTDVHVPDRQTVGYVLVLFALVASLSIVQVPIKTGQVTTDGDDYHAAAWMSAYADDQGWEYPENYVFSPWGQNRMYNYFVNGESESYGYAQRHYASFLESKNLTSWYKQLSGRTGFILTKNGVDLNQGTIYNYLHDHYGGRDAMLDSIGRFRAVYETADSSYKVFSPVNGALVAGRTSPNTTGVVRADIELSTSSFVYERQVRSAQNGWYMLRVPYPVNYDLLGNDSVTVSRSDTANGSIANQRSGNATWPLTANRGEYVFDTTGGNHGYISGEEWRTKGNWSGLYFNGSEHTEIPDSPSIDGTDEFTLSVRFKTGENINYKKELPYPRIVSKSYNSAYRNTDGYQIVLSHGRILGIVGNGTSAAKVWGERVSNDSWYNVTLTWNGSTVRLYVEGDLVDSGIFTGSPENDQPLAFGSSSNGKSGFVGSIESVSYKNQSD